MTDLTPTKTPIVLIHGLWMTPKSWTTWAEHFRAQGHEVLVPGWPGIEDRSVADIRRDPSALEGIGLTQIADHYERVIRELPVKPIIMGHSFGGLLTQMLADRDLGATYVGVTPGQPAANAAKSAPAQAAEAKSADWLDNESRGAAAEPAAALEAKRETAAPLPPPKPEAWIEEIRKLRRQGQPAEAERSLREFRAAYPDYPLPEDLR